MAEETDNLDQLLADLGRYSAGAAGSGAANAAVQSAYQAIIKNLKDRFGDYEDLGPAGYKDITPAKLGPSALSSITPDAQARLDEQAAISQLDDIAKSGGLTLSDMAALDELERKMSRGASARNASVADQFAARGQLGAGRQMQLQLANAQNATENANRRGESIAAQAQQRAIDAVLKKGEASHAISKEDYARQRDAAAAEDAINRYNASMETDAQKANNSYAGQAYDDALKKLSGQTGLTSEMNSALLGSGRQQGNTIAGQAYGASGLIGDVLAGAGKAASKLGKTKSGGGGGGLDDPGLDAGGQSDLAGERGGPADLTAGEDVNADTTGAVSDPAEWENPY